MRRLIGGLFLSLIVCFRLGATDVSIIGPLQEPVAFSAPVEAQVSGWRLLVANPYRGLQVIDVRNPDDPTLIGRVPIEGHVRALHVLSETVVVAAVETNFFASRIVVVRISGTPEIIVTLDLPGRWESSQFTGSMLHVATRRYDPAANPPESAAFTAIDLRQPQSPLVGSSLLLPVQSPLPVVRLTPDFAFLPNSDGLQVIPLSTEATMLAVASTIALPGFITGSDAIDQRGGVLRFVAQRYELRNAAGVLGYGHYVLSTELWSLAAPDAPVRLGGLEEERADSAYDVRFDGDRVWMRSGDLHLVDLADPTAPRARDFQVSALFDFLPLGDRLLTCTTSNRGASYDLYALPALPTEDLRQVARFEQPFGPGYPLQRPTLGPRDVFTLGRQTLVRVPFNRLAADGQTSETRTAFLEIFRNQLVPRGKLPGTGPLGVLVPVRNRLLALTGSHYRSLSVPGARQPQVRAELRLAYPVAAVQAKDGLVFAANNFVEASGPDFASLTVTEAGNDTRVLAEFELGEGRVIGLTRREDRLYVLARGPQPPPGGAAESQARLVAFDIADARHPRRIGEAILAANLRDTERFDALWLANGALVWAAAGTNFERSAGWETFTGLINYASTVNMSIAPIFSLRRYHSPGTLLAFRVNRGDVPVPVAAVPLRERVPIGADAVPAFSRCFASGDQVFVSHQVRIVLSTSFNGVPDESIHVPFTQFTDVADYLDVVDFRNSAAPIVHAPIAIPATLVGVPGSGGLLYFGGFKPDIASENNSHYPFSLHIASFDGVKATTLATAEISEVSRTDQIAIDDAHNAWIATHTFDLANQPLPLLQRWSWSVADGLEHKESRSLPFVVYELHLFSPTLLAGADAPRGSVQTKLILLDLNRPDLGPRNVGSALSAPPFMLDAGAVNESPAPLAGLVLPQGDYGIGLLPFTVPVPLPGAP